MGMLSLTFRGPFLVVVPPPTGGVPSPTISIYAPCCDQHLGSVFFGDGSYPIFGSLMKGNELVYTVSGADNGLVTNPGKISYQWDWSLGNTDITLSPDNPAAPQNPAAPALSNAYFCITVPRPKIFYALGAVPDTEVVPNNASATNVFPNWATCFRLYYDWNLTTQINLTFPVNAGGQTKGITPPAGSIAGAPGTWLPLADSGDIEFQYNGPGNSDPDHQDAFTCFSRIAQLAGIPWWLNFDNGDAGGGAAFRTGSDCTALPIVVGMNN
jgi:hypothetical protein